MKTKYIIFSKKTKMQLIRFRAGIMGNGRGEVTQHNPKFDLDEDVFHTTAGLMAYIALNLNDRL